MDWIEKRAQMRNLHGEYSITGYEARPATGGLVWITCMFVGGRPAFQYGAQLRGERSGNSVVYDLDSAKRGAENALIFLHIARERGTNGRH